MTDQVDEIARRAGDLYSMGILLTVVLTPGERARLRQLAAEWRDRDGGDPPTEQVLACLDMPIEDPRRAWPADYDELIERYLAVRAAETEGG